MTDWPTIVVRFVLYADFLILFGLATFALYALRGEERRTAISMRAWLVTTSGLGLLLSALSLAVMAAAMAGVPLSEVSLETIALILSEPSIGSPWVARMMALAMALALSLATMPGKIRLAATTVAGAIALATLAWTGHGAMDEGVAGQLHLGADILHLLAAGIWVGALIGLGMLVSRPRTHTDVPHLELSYRALQGFAPVGTLVVGTIVVTGLVNSWLLVGPPNVLTLASTQYGQLLIAKLALFAIMLALAAANRFRLTPAFGNALQNGDHGRALAALRQSLAVETICVATILALVARMGTLMQPMSAM